MSRRTRPQWPSPLGDPPSAFTTGTRRHRRVRTPAALLVLALLIVPAAAAGAEYQLFYSERASRFNAEGFAAEDETRGFRFTVAQENVTRVEFVLTWAESDDATGLSAPDVFSLTAQDPQGRPVDAPARSATGEARLESRIRSVPRDGPVDADALDARLAETTDTRGMGEWRAWVKLEDAGNPSSTTFDKGNSFTLVAIIHHYEGVPMRVVAMGAPQGTMASDVPLPWGLALGGLLPLAGGLAAAIWLQARRRKVSLDGENTPSPGR